MLLKTLLISTGSVLVIKNVVSYLYHNIKEIEGASIFQDLNWDRALTLYKHIITQQLWASKNQGCS